MEKSTGSSASDELLEAMFTWVTRSRLSRMQLSLFKCFCTSNSNKGTKYQMDIKQQLQPLLSMLMQGNGDVTFTDRINRTLLHQCILQMSVNPHDELEEILSRQLIFIICKLGASIIADDCNGNSPLSIALTKKRMDLVDALLARSRTGVTKKNGLGQTTLHILIGNYSNGRDCCKDYIKLVRYLVNSGADVNTPDNYGVTPLHLISKSLDTECGVTSLHLIVESLDVDLLKKLKRDGADLQIQTNTGDNLLTTACKNLNNAFYRSDALRFINWLLKDENFDANSQNKDGFAALYYASASDNLAVIEALVNAGADLHAVAIDGTNCLHSVAMSSSFEVMRYMIKRGVNFNLRDNVYGFTLIHAAAFSSDERKCEWLLRNKFDPNDHGKCDLTPLHLASLVGNVKVIGKLIEHGGNVNCKDSVYKYTPLHLASMSGRFPKCMKKINRMRFDGAFSGNTSSLVSHCLISLGFHADSYTDYKATIDALLSAGADVNARDKRGCTPLHYATRQPDNEIVEILLKAGARVDAEDNASFTPIQHSLFTTVADDRRLKCLLRFGANINDIELTSEEIFEKTKVLPSKAVSSKIQEHLVKLDVVGLPISYLHRSYLVGLKLDRYYAACSEEVTKLREYMLTCDVSLYDLLHVNFRLRGSFANRLPSNLEIEFPHYCDVIRSRCNEAINRVLLLKSAETAYQSLTGLYWPELCVEYIFSFLSNRNLNVLIDSVTENDC